MKPRLDKAKIKEHHLNYLFSKRLKAAKEEYSDAVRDSIYATQIVSYRNNTFNPLDLKPKDITSIYELKPNTEHARRLDRYIRVMDDLTESTGHLTYILNFVESVAEFNLIVNGSGTIYSDREEEVLNFIKQNQDKLRQLKRMKLLSEMV
ncbi:hypothetical protein JA1_0039 [Vibrio phage JA-1]|uniref:Uncharacterized protein n=1 Tax=Vibrio phage JA-1 TaxID=1283071 RepID=R9R4G8_9CAUD|nr:hypothetical protein M612_gp64 [Vibrio phage JA-1]AGI61792.1 hypothetical protein JA1_0039 [Vibrio phage JA-1]